MGAKFRIDLGEAVGGGGIGRAFRVELGERGGDGFHLFLKAEQFVKDREAFVEDGAAGEREAILRQVSDAHAFSALDLTVVEAVESGKDLHERGFAGAVRADQSSALVGSDQPVGILKEKLGAESLAGPGELQHGSILPGDYASSDPRLRRRIRECPMTALCRRFRNASPNMSGGKP